MPVTVDGSAGVTTNVGAVYNGLQSGTAKAWNWNGSTLNTFLDYTSIPSWVERITILFSGISTNGTSHKLIQLGTASGLVSTGYLSTGAYTQATAGFASSTAGFLIYSDNAAFVVSGSMTLHLLGSNTWVSNHTTKVSTGQLAYGGGDVTLADTLTQLRITTVNGTDRFDAGSVNIFYE
jgi:hypothetical protein